MRFIPLIGLVLLSGCTTIRTAVVTTGGWDSRHEKAEENLHQCSDDLASLVSIGKVGSKEAKLVEPLVERATKNLKKVDEAINNMILGYETERGVAALLDQANDDIDKCLKLERIWSN